MCRKGEMLLLLDCPPDIVLMTSVVLRQFENRLLLCFVGLFSYGSVVYSSYLITGCHVSVNESLKVTVKLSLSLNKTIKK